MPITVDWYPEPYIRRSVITGLVTTLDVEAWVQAELALISRQTHMLHYITDVRGAASSNVRLVKMTTVNTFLRHPHTGWFALIGATPLISFASLMLQRVAGMRFMTFPTTEEAQTYLLELVRIDRENAQPSDSQISI